MKGAPSPQPGWLARDRAAEGEPAPPHSPYNMSLRTVVLIAVGTAVVLVLYEAFRRALPASGPLPAAGLTLLSGFPLLFFLARHVVHRGVRSTIVAVSDGLLSLAERDYSLRLALERKDEVGMLVYRFNKLSDLLRRERNDLYQKEMLPEIILASTSMIVVICNDANRVIYSNAAAREFFGSGVPLEGNDLRSLIAGAPADVREAAEAPNDTLFTCNRPGREEPETFHLAKRYFEFSSQKHTLMVLRPLTRELARKEVETWKKAIRVLSHEMNNSLAPITSLVHSARLMLENPAHAQRLRAALDTIEERAAHLRTFLDGYASFARLPLPQRRPVPWKELLAGVEGLYTFKIEGELPERPALVDPAQIQQVLINLLKNAVESGSAPDAIAIAFHAETKAGVELRVVDRGKGMPEDVLKNALLPFYSTKKAGTGLGLALCREIIEAHGGRLSLHPRDGGGIEVRCWLPGAAMG